MKREKFGIIWRAALISAALMVALAAPALAASDGTATHRALLIGNSSYNDRWMSDLISCAYDLNAMKAALQSGAVGYDKVVTKASLTQSGIQAAVNDVLTWGQDEDDVTVFYYTGHGNAGGLAGVDYSTSTGNGTYSFSLLQSALAQVPGRVIVLLDACQSGGLIAKGASAQGSFSDSAIQAFSGAPSGGMTAKAITGGDHFHVIASSSQSQDSYNMEGVYGVTSWALCEAMGWSHNGAKAGNKLTALEGDTNGDGTVTIGEAYGHASQAVSELLARYKLTQDMQVYPSGSAQPLIRREAASAPAPAEVAKATTVTGTLNFSKACIAPGMKLQLKLNVEATNVSFASSRNAVATVETGTGLVTGVKYSSSVARISVNYKVGDKWYFTYCDVRVLPARYVVQALRFKTAALTLEQNRGYTMPVRFSPASARYKNLRWSSDNLSVAAVSAGGRIVAVSKSGTAIITATATSGVVATVVVTAVPASPTSVRLDKARLTLIPGQKYMLTETVYPVIAGDKTVTWTTGNSAVATVNGDGQVTAGGAVGKRTLVTARTVNGKKATCAVYVVANQSIPRTRPKGSSGKLVSSARRIYYNATGSLCVDMYFYNRTRSAVKVPMYDPGFLVLRLKDGTKIPVRVPAATLRTVRSGAYTLYPFALNLETYPALSGLDLRGSDAWYEAIN